MDTPPLPSKNRSISFGQINLRKSTVATTELNRRTNYDIVFITEPRVVKGKVWMEKGQNGSVIAQTGGCPRACIRSYLPSWKSEEFTSKDLAVAMINTPESHFCVASLYLDINLDVRHEGLVGLVKRCKERNTPLILGMDSNAHSEMWGSGN